MATTGFVFLLGTWCAALCIVDLRSRRLPNGLTLPGAVVIVVVAANAGELRPALVGALLLGGGYLLAHLLAPASMGGGDVKLALGLGAATGTAGAHAWLAAAFGAFALTACFGLASRAAGRQSTSLPHGPSMCLASMLALAV